MEATKMTANQILKLPVGALLKRKKFHYAQPQFGLVIDSLDPWDDTILVAWEQESDPLYQDYDFSLDEQYPEDKETWREPTHWIGRQRVPVYDENHKTFWRNWKRVA
jgi:hypothetical protein